MEIDYYAEAESIAQTVALQGYSDQARSLRDAIECGSTATEILMALRSRVAALDASGVLNDAFTVARVRRLLAALNSELR